MLVQVTSTEVFWIEWGHKLLKTIAETKPKDAFLRAIAKMDEKKWPGLECIKGDAGGTTEQKLKVFSL